MHLHTLLQPIAAAAATLALASAAQALVLVPPAASNDLSNWSCVGVCGSLAASLGGDVQASVIGSSSYGYVTTAGSLKYQVSAASEDAYDPWRNNQGNVDADADVGGKQAVLSPLWLGDKPDDKNLGAAEANGSRFTSPGFTVMAGQQLQLNFNYVSTDGKRDFGDYAWARLVDANDNAKTTVVLFTARSTRTGRDQVTPGGFEEEFGATTTVRTTGDFTQLAEGVQWAPIGNGVQPCFDDNNTCGVTGWTAVQYAFRATDVGRAYQLEVGVVNFADTEFDSGLAFDMQGLTVSAVPEPSAAATLLTGLAGLGFLAARRRSRG